jgi:hypothetical protein
LLPSKVSAALALQLPKVEADSATLVRVQLSLLPLLTEVGDTYTRPFAATLTLRLWATAVGAVTSCTVTLAALRLVLPAASLTLSTVMALW